MEEEKAEKGVSWQAAQLSPVSHSTEFGGEGCPAFSLRAGWMGILRFPDSCLLQGKECGESIPVKVPGKKGNVGQKRNYPNTGNK